ncbi:MAG: hypothetical protein WC909_03245 [Candidatus Paceibacterota bacterium]
MMKSGVCPVCGRFTRLTRHHVFKSCVWFDKPETQTRIFYVCRRCHDEIEKEITRRENIILQQYPELYTGVVEMFNKGAKNVRSKERHYAKS